MNINTATGGHQVSLQTVRVGSVEVFYREAGDPLNPALLLLHGFPTSSYMFRNLLPLLAAPDRSAGRNEVAIVIIFSLVILGGIAGFAYLHFNPVPGKHK